MRIGAFAVLLASTTMAWSQAIQAPGAPATGPYEDTASGVVFPVSAGAFQRFRLTRGADLNAGYMHATPTERVAATVFVTHVTPADGLCRGVANSDRATAAKKAGVLFDLAPPAVAGWDVAGFAGNGAGAMGSQEHFYYCRDGWVIQFAFAHAPDVDAEALENAFLAGFPLPEKH